MLVHTIAVELMHRRVMQGRRRGGQKGTETSLNSQLHNKKATSKQSADVPAVPAQNLSLFHVF